MIDLIPFSPISLAKNAFNMQEFTFSDLMESVLQQGQNSDNFSDVG